MPISDMPIFAMLRTRMHWHQERQRVLAENVANADIPEFRPRDLAPLDLGRSAPSSGTLTLARTQAAHVGGAGGIGLTSQSTAHFEARPSDSAVSLEDQMLKVASNQMDYQAAASLYSRSLALFKTALGKR